MFLNIIKEKNICRSIHTEEKVWKNMSQKVGSSYPWGLRGLHVGRALILPCYSDFLNEHVFNYDSFFESKEQ